MAEELADLKFFAQLVQRGHLGASDVEELLAAARAGGLSLPEMAVRRGLFSAERLQFLRRVEGEDVPELPGYEVLDLAGKGGTAVVVRARERRTGRDVAVKILHRDRESSEEARRAFLREARLLLKLRHENIVEGYRVGTYQGRLVFLMEYVPGRSVDVLLREGKAFDEDAALYIVLQVARALQYLSEQGVLHRDVKPGNILLTAESVVKLIDLGFAGSVGEAGEDQQTTVGSVAYISPEQARGQGDLDVRSDIYSLGATLYQLVAGELPFRGETSQELLAAQILASLNSEVLKSRRISPHMHYFIEKMMAKEREIRYQSPAELIQDIEEQIRGKKTLVYRDEGEAPAPAPGTPPRYPNLRRRRR